MVRTTLSYSDLERTFIRLTQCFTHPQIGRRPCCYFHKAERQLLLGFSPPELLGMGLELPPRILTLESVGKTSHCKSRGTDWRW